MKNVSRVLIRHSAVTIAGQNIGRDSKGFVCEGEVVGQRWEKWMKRVKENLCLWSVSSAAKNET